MKATVRRILGAGAALMVAVPSGAVSGQGPETGVGFWEGTYYCAQGLTGVRLAVRTWGTEPFAREATFTFYEPGGTAERPQGSFVLRGAVRDGRMRLEPHQWRQRYAGYAMVGLDGTIHGDIYAGQVTGLRGCTTFRMRSLSSMGAQASASRAVASAPRAVDWTWESAAVDAGDNKGATHE